MDWTCSTRPVTSIRSGTCNTRPVTSIRSGEADTRRNNDMVGLATITTHVGAAAFARASGDGGDVSIIASCHAVAVASYNKAALRTNVAWAVVLATPAPSPCLSYSRKSEIFQL